MGHGDGGGACDLDLSAADGFDVSWFNPRAGGRLQPGSVRQLAGGGARPLGAPPDPPAEDWVVLVRKAGGKKREP